MFNEIWLTIDEVCSLCNEKFETVRRKCKAGVLQSTFIKEGKFKKYSILLNSLPEKYQKKYFETQTTPVVIEKEVDYLRVHNVQLHKNLLKNIPN